MFNNYKVVDIPLYDFLCQNKHGIQHDVWKAFFHLEYLGQVETSCLTFIIPYIFGKGMIKPNQQVCWILWGNKCKMPAYILHMIGAQ